MKPMIRKCAVMLVAGYMALLSQMGHSAVANVSKIVVKHAVPLDYLQVSEVEAISGGVDVALSSASATATAVGSTYAGSCTACSIDGVAPAAWNNMYHSLNNNVPGQFLEIDLGGSFSIDSLSIFGRTDGGWSSRDIYDVFLYDSADNLLFTALNASAFNAAHEAKIPGVPLPAAAWLFGSALLGLVTVARRRAAV